MEADPGKVAAAKLWLERQGVTKPTVGVCWRSGLIDPNRALEYSNLIDWAGVLGSEKVEVVNLQYDDCEAELQRAESKFGRRILRPPFNQRNDLEDVLGLMKTLDFVMSAHTAVLHLSAYSGSKAISIDPTDQLDWPYLGQKNLPWYATVTGMNVRELAKPSNQKLTGCMGFSL